MKANPILLPTVLGLSLMLFAGCTLLPELKTSEAPPAASREAPKPVVVPPPVAVPVDKAQQELLAGIASYENGSYKPAARQLQSALSLGLDSPAEQARAHKYLAFMHCVGGRQNQCRDEFRKALEADPSFSLTPAEAGHPTWGPVFRKLKAAAGKPAKK